MLNVTEMKIVAQETENSLRQFQTGETDPKLVVRRPAPWPTTRSS